MSTKDLKRWGPLIAWIIWMFFFCLLAPVLHFGQGLILGLLSIVTLILAVFIAFELLEVQS